MPGRRTGKGPKEKKRSKKSTRRLRMSGGGLAEGHGEGMEDRKKARKEEGKQAGGGQRWISEQRRSGLKKTIRIKGLRPRWIYVLNDMILHLPCFRCDRKQWKGFVSFPVSWD
jgi:hypothetical protein